MKVLIAANSVWNLTHFRSPIIRMLQAAGAEVVAAAPLPAEGKPDLPSVKFIPLRHCTPGAGNPLQGMLLTLEFYRIFRAERPALILLYTIKPNIFGNFAAAILRIPVISTVTGLGYTHLRGGWLRGISQKLYKLAFRKTRHVVFHNPDDAQLFVSQGFVSEKQSRIIRGSGVDIEKFRPPEVPKKSEKFVFLFVGRLLSDKGIREYLAVAERLKYLSDAEWHIVGDLYPDNPASLTAAEMQKFLRENPQIIWQKYRDDVRPFLRIADVFVLPSYREGLPMSILEATASGLPIITTDVPGCRETVADGISGYLVQKGSIKNLAEKILEMYNLTPEKRKQMGECSRKKAVSEFSIETVTTAYKKLIEAIWQTDKTNE